MSRIADLSSPTFPREPAKAISIQLRVCSLVFALVVIAGTLCALRKDVTQGFDELAHTSYVASLQKSGDWWPRLETMRMLDPESFRFGEQLNYLNLPSPYYLFFARLGPQLEGQPKAIIIDRLMNVVLVALGVAALLAIGFFARLSDVVLYAYVVPIGAIPILAPLAGSINNDNAAFFGGAVALLGAWRLIATRRTLWLYVALGGVLIASWAKLTGLMLSGGMLAGVFLYLFWRRAFRFEWTVPAIAAVLLAAAPYFALVLQYGSPTPNTPGRIDMFVSGAHTAGWDVAPRLSPVSYTLFFVTQFVEQWMPSLSARNALNYTMLFIPVATALCAGVGVMFSLRRIGRREEGPLDILVAAGSIVGLATFAIHIAFSYRQHLAYGWMLDAYPRYYLPLIAIVSLATLSLLAAVKHPRARSMLAGFLIIGPIVFRLLGGPLG
ncbi:MAG TPA: hypothetical protein VJR71_01790 [Pseudolabrys sp.]|nr:hypothetical protein [Pseudolabrys sp.]